MKMPGEGRHTTAAAAGRSGLITWRFRGVSGRVGRLDTRSPSGLSAIGLTSTSRDAFPQIASRTNTPLPSLLIHAWLSKSLRHIQYDMQIVTVSSSRLWSLGREIKGDVVVAASIVPVKYRLRIPTRPIIVFITVFIIVIKYLMTSHYDND
jgi:hypothetical protein